MYNMWEADDPSNGDVETMPRSRSSILEIVETYHGMTMDQELRKAIGGTDKQYDPFWLHYYRHCIEDVAEKVQARSEGMVTAGSR